MGIRAGSCFDLGVNIGIGEVELGRYIGAGESSYLEVAKKAIGAADQIAAVLLSNNILVNRGQLDVLSKALNQHAGNDNSAREMLLTKARQLRIDYSESIHGFDKSHGTSYGTAFDLGSSIGMGEAQASFWGIGPNSLIDASAQLAISALASSKPFAEILKNIYPGVDPAAIDWVRDGYNDPERTGNGFKVAYQRFVIQREKFNKALHSQFE